MFMINYKHVTCLRSFCLSYARLQHYSALSVTDMLKYINKCETSGLADQTVYQTKTDHVIQKGKKTMLRLGPTLHSPFFVFEKSAFFETLNPH